MKLKSTNVEKIVFGVFMGFGILFLCLGILISVLVGRQDENEFVAVTAVIDEIEKTTSSSKNHSSDHRVYLDYEYDGVQYSHVRYNRYSSSMRVGKEITVRVNMYDPEEFYVGDMSIIFLLAFGGFGLLFGSIGGIPFAIISKKERHKKQLKITGRACWGTIEEVCQDYKVRVNGQHPKYFVVKYEDDSIVTATSHYKSDDFMLPGDGQEFVGKNIKIFVNPQNNQDYVVDVDSIQTEDQYYGF